MDIPRPKFCVGEVVDVIPIDCAQPKISDAEIIETKFDEWEWVHSGEDCEPSWGYKTNKDYDGYWWDEVELRKRPHNYWKDSVWTPTEIKDKCPA